MFLPGRRFIGYNSVALVVVMLVIGRTGIRSARGKTVYNSNRPSNRRNKTTELLSLRFQFQKKEKIKPIRNNAYIVIIRGQR